VVGQTDFSTVTSGATATNLNWPRHAAIYGTKLFVSDAQNNRVLIWNSIPTTNGQPADVVVGQANFTANSASTTQSGLSSPGFVLVVGSKLLVTDTSNNRILIWNSIPTTNNASADVVIGQSNFVSGSVNAGGSVSASSFNYPGGLAFYNNKLYLADSSNNRILVWNSIPSSNNVAADDIIGQLNFTTSTQNAGQGVLNHVGFASPRSISIGSFGL
jgi:hypothetical protein